MLETPEKILCVARSKWIASTDEEKVRQFFLKLMIELGYPKKLLSVESNLKGLIPFQKIPRRRADIICFMPRENTLKPLLLIECKRGPLKEADFYQATGYNFYLKALYIGVAAKNELMIRDAHNKQKPIFHLPSYQELIDKAYLSK